jgi:aminoglycoside phosphotransferase (APT) family kinase protein
MLSDYDKDQLARFLEGHYLAWGVRIDNVLLLHGGAASATYSFDALYEGREGRVRRGFVLRLQSHAGIMDAEQALEFAAYRSVQDRGVPAPMPVALVEDASILGAPFLLVERVEQALAASPFHPDPYGEFAEQIGRDFFAVLGRLAAIDPHDTELGGVVMTPRAEECWKRELDYWEQALAIDATEPQPIAEAAIRRLRKNPPPSPRLLSIVHGDLRHGNFLHDGRGRITAVLDWEMAHVGDPIEDLAWALDPIWCLGKPELAAGLIDREEAVKIWENAFGFEFDPERYRWWSLLASVKGLAIWARAAKAYSEGANLSPMTAFTGWYCATRHNHLLAERLAAAPRGGL